MEKYIEVYIKKGLIHLLNEFVKTMDASLIEDQGIEIMAEDFFFDSGVLYGSHKTLLLYFIPTLNFLSEVELTILSQTFEGLFGPTLDIFVKNLIKDKKYLEKMKNYFSLKKK